MLNNLELYNLTNIRHPRKLISRFKIYNTAKWFPPKTPFIPRFKTGCKIFLVTIIHIANKPHCYAVCFFTSPNYKQKYLTQYQYAQVFLTPYFLISEKMIVNLPSQPNVAVQNRNNTLLKINLGKVDEIVSVMVDVVCSKQKTIRVNGGELPQEMVSRFN